MATRWIDFEVHGEDELMRFLVVGHDRANAAVWEMLDDIRHRGEYYLRLYAPAYSGELLRRIGSNSPIPSGGPFGPELEASAGVREGDRHPLYVHGGTGIYKAGRLGASAALRTPGTDGYIKSLRPGKPLTFQKKGEPRRWRMWVRGQKANPFVLYAYQQLVPYAKGRARVLFNRMDTRT